MNLHPKNIFTLKKHIVRDTADAIQELFSMDFATNTRSHNTEYAQLLYSTDGDGQLSPT